MKKFLISISTIIIVIFLIAGSTIVYLYFTGKIVPRSEYISFSKINNDFEKNEDIKIKFFEFNTKSSSFDLGKLQIEINKKIKNSNNKEKIIIGFNITKIENPKYSFSNFNLNTEINFIAKPISIQDNDISLKVNSVKDDKIEFIENNISNNLSNNSKEYIKKSNEYKRIFEKAYINKEFLNFKYKNINKKENIEVLNNSVNILFFNFKDFIFLR